MPSYRGSSHPRIEAGSLTSTCISRQFFTTSATWKLSSHILKYPRFPSSIIFLLILYILVSETLQYPNTSSPDQSPGLQTLLWSFPRRSHLRAHRYVKCRQGHSGTHPLLLFPVFLIFSVTQVSPSFSLTPFPPHIHQLLWNLAFLSSPPPLPLFMRLTPLLLLLKQSPHWAPHTSGLFPLQLILHSINTNLTRFLLRFQSSSAWFFTSVM